MTRDSSPAGLRRGPEEFGINSRPRGVSFSGEDPLDIAQLNRADRFFPEGGLVLKVNTRDLPAPTPRNKGGGPTPRNQDFAPGSPRMKAGQFLAGSEIGPAGRARCRGPSSSDSPGSISSTTCDVARPAPAVPSGTHDRGRDTDQPGQSERDAG